MLQRQQSGPQPSPASGHPQQLLLRQQSEPAALQAGQRLVQGEPAVLQPGQRLVHGEPAVLQPGQRLVQGEPAVLQPGQRLVQVGGQQVVLQHGQPLTAEMRQQILVRNAYGWMVCPVLCLFRVCGWLEGGRWGGDRYSLVYRPKLYCQYGICVSLKLDRVEPRVQL